MNHKIINVEFGKYKNERLKKKCSTCDDLWRGYYEAWTFKEKQLKEKDKEIEDIYHQIEATLIMNDKTSKKLEIALDALEFYSHEKNRDGWGVGQVAGLISGHRYDISCCACNEENKGKTARQALEKISKLESEK